MGEEQKEERKGQEEGAKEEEKKEGEKKDKEEPPDILLKVYMHCEGCAKKVEKSLRKFQGVDEVKADSRAQTVVVKAKAVDPVKICERVQRKTGRRTVLVSPLPKPQEEEPPKEEEKKEEVQPAPITVILRVRMDCEACAQVLQRRIKKMEGVESVVTDLPNEKVVVKGFVDPNKLVENVYRRTRKQASILRDEEKAKEQEQEQKEKKEEAEEEKKAEEKKELEEEEADGEKEEEDKEEETSKEDNFNRSEYWPTKCSTEYVCAPQIFSDENPNACSVM